MKNIVFFTYLSLWSMDNNKGAPSFYKTIDSYLKDGWNVTLIHPKNKDGVTPELDGLNTITFKPVFYPLIKIRKISFLGRILHSLHGNYMFYKLGKKLLKKYDNKACLYAYEVHGVKAGKKLKEEFNLPFITRFQGTVLAPIKDNWLNRLKKYPHFHALETEADLTIMTDDGTQGDKVLKRLRNKSKRIEFWKNGVDIEAGVEPKKQAVKKVRADLGLSSNNKVLITISRLASWKRVDRAIKALSVVVKEKPNVKLVIVGDGDEKQKLIELTNKLKLNSNVIFAGAVPQSDIKNYLAIADIFLSLYDLSNVGNPLLEAMSSGKPIITLNVGDTSSIIKNEFNGILLDLDQLNKIPDYIHKILDNESYAKRLGNNAKQYAIENFWSWDDRMKAEISIVNNIYKNWFFKNKNNVNFREIEM